MPYWDHKAKPANSAGFLLCAPSRAYISPCTPEGTGEGIPPHGCAVPLLSALRASEYLASSAPDVPESGTRGAFYPRFCA